MLHAWDQVSFSDTESEAEELLHEIPQPLFRDRDLNRRLDHDALNRVNRYFERIFYLTGQPLSYRQVEEIAVNTQADVFAILTNIITCQQQHTEALRHTADFWRHCHDELYAELAQLRHRLDSVLEDMIINHRAESYGKRVIIDIQASESITKDDVRIVPTYI